MGDGQWVGPDTGGESAEYTETGGEGAYRKKRERRRARCLFAARSPDESQRGGKGRDHIIIDGKHRNLTIRGQSLGIVQANVRGIGTNQPIMDKLGVPEARPTYRQT